MVTLRKIPIMMPIWIKLTFIIFLFFPSLSMALSPYGIDLSTIIIAKEPSSLRGHQLMLNYNPISLQWSRWNIYFDGGFAHLWVNNTPYYTTVNIYSLAPVFRYK